MRDWLEPLNGIRRNMETIDIDGVEIDPLEQFLDYRGKVMKFAYSDERNNEAYFSVVHPGMIKGWHKHRYIELNYACIYGKILLVLYDDRADSQTYGNLMEIYLSPENYKLVHIPPGIVNGFKGLGITDSIVADMATDPYSEDEIIRLPLDYVEYNWFKKGE